jgi:hypothetical protein
MKESEISSGNSKRIGYVVDNALSIVGTPQLRDKRDGVTIRTVMKDMKSFDREKRWMNCHQIQKMYPSGCLRLRPASSSFILKNQDGDR